MFARKPFHFLIATTFLAAPLCLAHSDGGVYGTPKTYCEDTIPGETYVHDYMAGSGIEIFGGMDLSIGNIGIDAAPSDAVPPGPVVDGLPVEPPQIFIRGGYDGSIPPCPYDAQWDGHFEWAQGGAWLLACEGNHHPGTGGCANPYGKEGDGSLVCHGTYADHSPQPDIWVFDHVLSTAALPVTFTVAADFFDNLPSADPAAPNCGDFEADYTVSCVDHCTPDFPPGMDGSYLVFVEGSFGHIWST